MSPLVRYHHILISQEDMSGLLQINLIKHVITRWLLCAKRLSFMSPLMPTFGISGPRDTFK